MKFGKQISLNIKTLAQILTDSGYQTGTFITNINAGKLAGLDRGFEHYHDAIKTFSHKDALRSFPKKAFFDWLDQRRKEPFFAYIHTAEPHRPYIPPAPYSTMFNPGYQGRITGYYRGKNGYRTAKSPEDREQVTALYDGEIRFADDAVADLLEGLEHRGLRKNTIIILTSDHGEELGERGGWNHGHTAYDELLRVPLIFSGPLADIPAGRRIKMPVQLIDVAPTILEIAGLLKEPDFEGESLFGLMRGQNREHFENRAVYAATTQQPRKMAMIQESWKLILNPTFRFLFNLSQDPEERSNLFNLEKTQARNLAKNLRAWAVRSKRIHDQQVSVQKALSDEDKERLRSLGYIK